ncbi:hypothetical protein ACLOJK_026869 [Asimina triloba]
MPRTCTRESHGDRTRSPATRAKLFPAFTPIYPLAYMESSRRVSPSPHTPLTCPPRTATAAPDRAVPRRTPRRSSTWTALLSQQTVPLTALIKATSSPRSPRHCSPIPSSFTRRKNSPASPENRSSRPKNAFSGRSCDQRIADRRRFKPERGWKWICFIKNPELSPAFCKNHTNAMIKRSFDRCIDSEGLEFRFDFAFFCSESAEMEN